jgi:hypothetical protein
MTLGDFFNYAEQHQGSVVAYYLFFPIVAGLAYLLGKGQGHTSPWKYVYSVLIYGVAIPGIFAITLNVYLFLFERQSIMQMNLINQILPILSMFVTFYLIKKNVAFDLIPGFSRISGLIMIITGLIILMWILEKTHILAITILPVQMVVAVLLILVLMLTLGWRKASK